MTDFKIVQDVVEAIKESGKGTSSYDTTAEVVRIEDDTAWVHIPGGINETPVKMSIHAESGDKVRVRVAGGKAWIVGNDTAPPTDDKTANVARSKAENAQMTADEARKTAEHTDMHFFTDKEGAHVTLGEHAANEGRNLLMDANGVRIRDGTEELAKFTDDEMRMGKSDGSNVSITPGKTAFANENGEEVAGIVNGGYTDRDIYVQNRKSLSNESGDFPLPAGNRIQLLFMLMDEQMVKTESFYLEISIVNTIRSGSAFYENLSFIFDAEDASTKDENGLFSAIIQVDEQYYDETLFERNVSVTLTALANMVIEPIGKDLRYYVHYLRRIPAAHFEFGKQKAGTSSGAMSFGAGDNFNVPGDYAAAIGRDTEASGPASFAQNTGTIAAGQDQTAMGRYNVADDKNQYAIIIGNGTDDANRRNLLTLDWNGNLAIVGKTLNEIIEETIGYRIIEYTYTYSIAANASINITAAQLGMSAPEGFFPAAVLAARSGYGNVAVRTFNGAATGEGQALCLKNIEGTAQENKTAVLTVLYLSTNLSGEGGGSSGTYDYNALYNKPQIEEVTLQGNKYIEDLGIEPIDYTHFNW